MCALGCSLACADVTPGQVVTKSDVPALGSLVSPSIEWILAHGASLKIVEPRPIVWPKAYREATEKYSSQVRFAADGLTLENYVAGAPFPNPDPNDPTIALKIMWNYEYRPYPGTDDFVEYDFPLFTGVVRANSALAVEREAQLGEAKQAAVVAYEDIYDRAGQLWKVWIDDHQFKKQGKSGTTRYDEDQDFYAGLLMLDMQLGHATYVPHPSAATEGDGWFFNAGEKAVTAANPHGSVPDVFTIANLIAHGS